MNHKTHHYFTKMMFPNVSYKTIDKINSSIDNPSKRMIAIQNSGLFDKNVFDAFGLTKHGHRKYNHDIASAMFNGYMSSPQHGAEIAITHLALDRFGNMLHDLYGSNEKDAFEVMLNKWLSMERATKQKRMFF